MISDHVNSTFDLPLGFDDAQTKRRRRTAIGQADHSQKRRAIDRAIGGRQPVQHRFIARELAVVSGDARGKPNHGIEPMQHGREMDDGLGQQIASIAVRQLVDHNETKLRQREFLEQAGRQQQLRPKDTM